MGNLDTEVFEFLVELGELASGIHQSVYARPSRMGRRINIQLHGVIRRAPCRSSRELGTVCHHDLDFMVIRVNILFHQSSRHIDLAPHFLIIAAGIVQPYEASQAHGAKQAAERRSSL